MEICLLVDFFNVAFKNVVFNQQSARKAWKFFEVPCYKLCFCCCVVSELVVANAWLLGYRAQNLISIWSSLHTQFVIITYISHPQNEIEAA